MQLPARIGKYELFELLGGGMSKVYLAKDTLIDRTVVVKILTEAGSRDADAKARFLHEAKLAGNIVHDNVVNVYDYVTQEGQLPYIVMEYVRGESLRDAIKNNRTGDLRNKLQIARQIAAALEYVHSKKIIHRDIKPDNIHVDANGRVKLMDFGIAKAEGVTLTKVGFTLGTPFYMAPEQVLGQQVTILVDIYAFGILLFELIVGRRPITAETVDKIFQQILREPLRLEPLREAGAPDPVVDLVTKCTAKNPAERYQSFAEVRDALDRILEPGGAEAGGRSQVQPQYTLPAAQSGLLPAQAPPPQSKPVSGRPPVQQQPAQPQPRNAQPSSAVTPPQRPAPVKPAAQPSGGGLVDMLPPQFRTQTWVMVFAALAMVLVLGVVYWIVSLLSR